MEKRVNNLAKNNPLRTYITRFILLILLSFGPSVNAQDAAAPVVKKYTIGDIIVSGNTSFSSNTVITFSGLRKGDEIAIPGEKISSAIKKLWSSNLFSSIDIYVTKYEGDTVYLDIELVDLPELKEVIVKGVKEKKVPEIIKENKLQPGTKVTENLITTTKNYLENTYRKKGFLNAKVNISTAEVVDTIQKKRVNMLMTIDKGNKIKVKKINFVGAEKVNAKKLRKSMKNTKQKNPIRVFKRSKYIDADYKEDLVSVIDKYKENGYRDARIISDSIIKNNDNTISLNIKVEEGEKYSFGKINFLGNTVYTDAQLKQVLRINEGDTYNGVELEKRIQDNENPDADDITNLYQNSGYLFSTITPVEVSAEGNVIDLEIRVTEGKPAYFNNVSVTGNETTNDHVVYRVLRTRPGQLYSKSNVLRSYRELGQMGFFDAQQISPNIKNASPTDGTVDIEYSVVERGSSQIELQGGYGGGGFIGTLGLSFNNFAIKDIFKKEAYKPIPMGDGQTLSLRLQASRFFQTYSFSFIEPWLGGKKPVQFSTSLSHTKQFLFDPITRNADKDRRFNITGISVGLAKQLTIPDDYFLFSSAVSFQHYNLKNYNTGLFTFGDGYSNNLSFTLGLTRNNTAIDPIYPTSGSNFNATAKFSLPYSTFNNVDYKALKEEREQLFEDLADDPTDTAASERIGEIDQERFKWLEFYKIKFKGEWYTTLVDKLVLTPNIEFGFVGAYNNDRGVIPFERFFLGGDGLGNYSLDGREAIRLRGYPNQSLSSQDGGTIFNKFSLELRYPITLGAQAKIYGLAFLEGGASYDSFRDYNPFDLKRSAGLGIRIFMPAFGLLGIDFGHGFDPLPGLSVKNGWETHFIIGQRF
ncbi:MAG: outer membrane protein assembly factor BamA [Bacteroidia bacterium]|nr:outer membrane protein assembly factor BamA [Bacteroidia bacterium]NND24391.1 outer membrane protein assembly factor BamA [Flavobacteriaceae bacterium]MBT8279785.1 outer membrane protein assembly factor BamA [Bacteroidia bacterium]NNK59872.1 outer membrane protein assembly factor BamA [Flavobacteriaceae bacterium]NNL31753.1 outer membrane protein assembly factor BamA [Flavobacteriaceae bacterium]